MRDDDYMAEHLENRYRDFLAEHLELISNGMTLLDTEMMLPNDLGAKGFVDLVVRDKFGVIVLIEIKRSDSAARDAMHELFKYATLFRKEHGLDIHQFRCILLSTTWHELRVPFSEFLKSSPFEIEGRELLIGQDGDPSETRDIEALTLDGPVSLCPKHEILLYERESAREADHVRLTEALDAIGILDYFFFHLDLVTNDPTIIHPHATYLVLGEFSPSLRNFIQYGSATPPEESFDIEAEWGESLMDPSIWEHEENALARVNRSCRPDTVEIGYPDKLRVTLESWKHSTFVRSGRFKSQVIWPDDALFSAALSEGDKHTNYFTYQASTANNAACKQLLSKIEYSLMGAGQWEKSVPRLLRALLADAQVSAISVRLYSPCDLLFGLFALDAGRPDYLPGLEVVADSHAESARIFIGHLTWDRRTLMEKARGVSKSLPEGIGHYLMAQNFGEQWREETRLCALHGLQYSIFELPDTPEGGVLQLHTKGSDLKFTQISSRKLQRISISSFAAKNSEYLRELNETLHRSALGLPF